MGSAASQHRALVAEAIIELSKCRKGAGTFIEHKGRELAVFRVVDPERVFVVDNSCPHASGNLSGGEVHGECVTCPWHHWEFDLSTGQCTHSDQARVTRHLADVRDGVVWATLDDSTTEVSL